MQLMRKIADDVRDLERAEHLVLFGFRLTALGRGDCPVLHRTFCGLMGGGGGDAALGDLLVFVRVVGAAGARQVRLHTPGCCGLTDDERCVLGVIAAAQSSLTTGDDRLLRERLSDLLGVPATEPALMAAQHVAAALTVAGLDLPLREPTQASAPTPTLH